MNARTRSRLWRTTLFATLGGLLVLAWTQRGRIMPVAVGSPAPAYSAVTLTGDTFSLAQQRGKVVVLNIWATWCAPCRREMPALESLHRRLAPEGLVVVGVSTDVPLGGVDPLGQPGGEVRAFVEELELTFTIARDPEGKIERAFLVQGLPTTLVIDKEGRIDRKVLGAKEWDDDEHLQYFRRLLAS